jgi:hypothetical protein
MLTAAQALSFAKKHVETWNSHDLRPILALYSDSAELYSPLAATLRGDAAVRGQAALRDYFQQGLAKYPDLRFELLDVFSCQTSLTLLFVGAGGRRVCEVLFLDEAGKVSRVYAHYLCEVVP